MTDTPPSGPSAIVFRKRLLAYSETFIADQGRFLPHWRPVFAGISGDARGRHLLDEHSLAVCLLNESVSAARRPVAGIVFKRLGSPPGPWLSQLRAYRPGLIHAHFGPDALTALSLKRHLGVPLIATFHGFDICVDTPVNRYRRNRHRVFAEADRIIAVSRFVADKLIDHGCPADKITAHAIGIDVDRFHRPPVSAQRSGVVFVGRLVEKKGCRYLIDAMQRLGGDLSLQIVGDGPLRSDLQARAAPLGERIRFLGRRTPAEVRNLMAAAAVVCVPSVTGSDGDAEGLGMVFLEAQATGAAVVSTVSGGIPEAVIDGQTGLLVAERDSEALAVALRQILRDPEFAGTLGRAGARHVRRSFNVRTQSAALENIYDEVSGRRPPAA